MNCINQIKRVLLTTSGTGRKIPATANDQLSKGVSQDGWLCGQPLTDNRRGSGGRGGKRCRVGQGNQFASRLTSLGDFRKIHYNNDATLT